jgi:hypothetical protein
VRDRFRELTLSDVLVPDADRALRALIGRVGQVADADYIVASAWPGSRLYRGLLRAGFLPVPPVVGPTITGYWLRTIGGLDPARISSWRLAIGDFELL